VNSQVDWSSDISGPEIYPEGPGDLGWNCNFENVLSFCRGESGYLGTDGCGSFDSSNAAPRAHTPSMVYDSSWQRPGCEASRGIAHLSSDTARQLLTRRKPATPCHPGSGKYRGFVADFGCLLQLRHWINLSFHGRLTATGERAVLGRGESRLFWRDEVHPE
jgi:hypothetical protein